jgi:3-carboxy-cis,cis-muconate cycloisomerase/3-oxoadipate enol-lactonase
MMDVLADEATFQAMARFEAALAEAEAEFGLIPHDAAAAIAKTCAAVRFDADRLAAEARRAGPLAIPFVKALRAAVAAHDSRAAAYVHVGATSQDVLDTALCLQIRRAGDLIAHEIDAVVAALVTLAERHADTLAIGRTLLQAAQPVTFGLKAAHWAALAAAAGAEVKSAFEAARLLQLGGATGTLAMLGPRAPAIAAALARRLGLVWPGAPWHARRLPIAGLGAALGLFVGALGKIARDIALLMQTGIAEVAEPSGGSSAMPHKRNPVATVAIAGVASRTPGLVAALLAGLPLNEHERGLGGWQSERAVIEDLLLLSHGAAAALSESIAALTVDEARMARAIADTNGFYAGEAAVALLAGRVGHGEAARLVDQAMAAASAEGRSFAEALRDTATDAGRLDDGELARLADPAAHLGQAKAFAAALVAAARGAGTPARPTLGFLARGGIDVHFRCDGRAANPAIVLSNSLGTDLTMWDEAAALLAPHFHVVRLDLRGHGLSGAPQPGIAVDDLADDVVAVIDHLGIERAVFCGVSIGGLIGQSVAIRHGDRLSAAILCCTAPKIGTAESWQARIDLVRTQGMAAIAPAIIERWFGRRIRREAPAAAKAWQLRLGRVDADGYAALCTALAGADFRDGLARIRTPTLCLAGADDQAVPADQVGALAAAIPGAGFAVMAEVGHLPPLEAPADLVDAIRRFTSRGAIT